VPALTLLIVVTALLCASVTVLVLIGLRRLADLPAGLSGRDVSESNIEEPARHRPLLDDPLSVLVVDDDEGLRALLRASFEIADIEVAEAASVKSAAISIADRHPDVIVLDVGMPEVSGLVLCRGLKADPYTRDIPICLLTGDAISEASGRQAGADAVESERIAIERTSPQLASLVSLAEAVDRRKGSPAHSRRVARCAAALARHLRLPEEDVERVRIAALLRDVGEVGVAESILSKPGPLDARERLEVERHPEIGARIVGTAQLGRVGEWILTHHERPDGQGYPRGLRGHQIPLEGRIVAVADAYAAMTAERPYRRPFSAHRAKAELQARAGTQFDHDVVEAFLAIDAEPGAEPDAGDTVPAAEER